LKPRHTLRGLTTDWPVSVSLGAETERKDCGSPAVFDSSLSRIAMFRLPYFGGQRFRFRHGKIAGDLTLPRKHRLPYYGRLKDGAVHDNGKTMSHFCLGQLGELIPCARGQPEDNHRLSISVDACNGIGNHLADDLAFALKP